MTKEELGIEFERLCDDTKFKTKEQKITRGNEFGNFLNRWLTLSSLKAHAAFRPKGEEIDGGFIYGFGNYLLEAKWQAKPLPASSIYAFRGKVDGKLTGTRGIFISISGFSRDCTDAVIHGKTLNIILVDGNDISYCFKNGMTFIEMLDIKLWQAGQYGLHYYKLVNISKENLSLSTGKIEGVNKLSGIAFVMEGAMDQVIIQNLAARILRGAGIARDLAFHLGGGKSAVARFANAIYVFRNVPYENESPDNFDYTEAKIVLIVDGDGNVEGTEFLLKNEIQSDVSATLIIVEPDLERWFQQANITSRLELLAYAKANRLSRLDATLRLTQNINIESLLKTEPTFYTFYKILVSD